MREFFKKLPYNTKGIFTQVHIEESNCTLYVPAWSEHDAKRYRDSLHDFFNREDENVRSA